MADLMLPASAPVHGQRWLLLWAFVPMAAVVVLLALLHPALALLPAVALVALPAVVWLFRRPLLNLCVVLGGFVLIADYTEGLQIQEVIYGLYFALYLAHWFITRVVLYRSAEFSQMVSKAVLLFLLTVTLLVVPAIVFYDAPALEAILEWRMVLMVGLFFPVREAVARYRWAVPAIGITMVAVWSFIALRNVLDYRSLILNAVYQYQVGRGRVIANDNVLMVSSMCLATWALFATRWKARLVLGVVWALCFAALILTQSRSYWVAFAFGMGLLMLVAPWTVHKRMSIAALCGILLFALLAGVFADEARLIVGGLVNRLFSIGKATTMDISFLSRFYEARGAMGRFSESPLFGHGPGAYFTFSDIIGRGTVSSNFIHNGYVSLLFKYGLWGFALALTLWLGSIWNGFLAFKTRAAQPAVRLAGLAAALCLCGYLLSALAAPPFLIDDNTFNIGLLTGVATGARARAIHEAEGET